MGKRTGTHKRWIHIFHIVLMNIPRRTWVQAGRVWGPSDVTPMVFYNFNTWTEEKVFASWLKRSYVWVEATEYNGWIRWKTRAWSGVNQYEKKCLRKKQCLEPRSKMKDKQSTIATHEAVVYYPMIDWKTKKKQLNDKWDVCDALVVSRPGRIVHKIVLLKSSLAWNQNGLGSKAFLYKKLTV